MALKSPVPNIVIPKPVYPKDVVPSVSRSRTEKFHKLFKLVPEDEELIDYFSCAFVGDILLQGFLYISLNWICFNSKIRARGHLLQIPIDKVVSITREKTALIFPNAIGVQTAEEKYVFGSFVSRDTAYKLLIKLWKNAQDSQSSEDFTDTFSFPVYKSPVEDFTDTFSFPVYKSPVVVNLSTLSVPITPADGESNDESQSVSCETDSTDNDVQGNILDGEPKAKPTAEVTTTREVKADVYTPAKGPSLNCQKAVNNINKQLNFKLKRIPRIYLLLAVCVILVIFLLLSSVLLSHKILALQERLEDRLPWSPSIREVYRERMHENLLYLRSEEHRAVLQHLDSVLKANILVLQDVQMSLSTLDSPIECCSTYTKYTTKSSPEKEEI